MMLRKLLFALFAVLLVGTTAACGDDDNDKDNTDVDCTDPENADHDDCKTPPPPPVEGTPYCEEDENKNKPECKRDDAREGMLYSYVNALKLPGEDDDCCWDYTAGNNNDPDRYNNALEPILDLVGEFVEDLNLDELLEDLFLDGSLTLIFEYSEFPSAVEGSEDGQLNPGAFDMSLYLSDIAEDEEGGEPTVATEDRMAGKGEFVLGEELASIKDAFVRRNQVVADTDRLNLSLDLDAFVEGDALDGLGLPNPIELPLSAVRLRFDVEELRDGDDILGLKNTTDEAGNLITEDGGKSINFLSAVIEGESLVELLNPIVVGLCDLPEGTVSVSFDGTKGATKDPDVNNPVAPLIEVDADVVAELKKSEDSTCAMIGGMGDGLGGILGGFFDVDVNRNGVANGLSLGLNLGFTGAKVVD